MNMPGPCLGGLYWMEWYNGVKSEGVRNGEKEIRGSGGLT